MGSPTAAAGQLYQGERTHIGWTAREIVLPTMPGSMASGAIIKVAGITGRIRGMKYKRADGRTVRPSLVVLDDPQTDESARSLSQCATRESILAGAVLGLAGPGKKIAGHHALHRHPPGRHGRQHPRPRQASGVERRADEDGLRVPRPTRSSGSEYAEIRAESLRRGNGGWQRPPSSTAQHREAMDEGAVIAWPERFNHDELSAIQHAMNLQAAGRGGVLRRVPERAAAGGDGAGRRADGRPDRRQDQPHAARRGADRLQPPDDVRRRAGQRCCSTWWPPGRTTSPATSIDYGTYPDQKRPYFTLRDARHDAGAVATRAAGLEGAIYAGLEALTGELPGPRVAARRRGR